MHIAHRIVMFAALALWPTALIYGQTADPSGHWEGAIHAPGREVKVEVDLAKKDKGDFVATYGNPDDNLSGIPLSNVAVESSSVRFQLKVNGGGSFQGTLSGDGKTISGNFDYRDSGILVPFDIKRTGDAHFDAPSKSAPITKELEGRWNGTLDIGGTQTRLVLSLSNQADGTSTGNVVSLDEGGVEIPVTTITQKGSIVILDFKTVGGSYNAALSADKAELTGTFQQKQATAPLTFRRAIAVR